MYSSKNLEKEKSYIVAKDKDKRITEVLPNFKMIIYSWS